MLPTQVRLRGVPKWFPDGRSILIASALPGKQSTLYRVDPLTGKTEVLHSAAGPVRTFDISPDGKTIFYVQGCDGCPPPRSKLVRLDIESGTETELGKGAIWSVAISPDGKQIAYLDGSGLIAVGLEAGGEYREVYRGAGWVDNATQPLAWTPDQRYILFPRDDGRPGATDTLLMRVPVSGGAVEQMGLSMPGIQAVGVQPDGRRIYFSAYSPDEVWALGNLLAKPHVR